MKGYVYVRVEVDGEPVGMLRLPDNDHVRFVRERLTYNPNISSTVENER